jgi:hypothetical protein
MLDQWRSRKIWIERAMQNKGGFADRSIIELATGRVRPTGGQGLLSSPCSFSIVEKQLSITNREAE